MNQSEFQFGCSKRTVKTKKKINPRKFKKPLAERLGKANWSNEKKNTKIDQNSLARQGSLWEVNKADRRDANRERSIGLRGCRGQPGREAGGSGGARGRGPCYRPALCISINSVLERRWEPRTPRNLARMMHYAHSLFSKSSQTLRPS